MDNVSFHKSKEIKELILKSKNKIIYIPPYSPEYNPIEGVFHILKNKIRQKDEIINEKNIKCAIEEIKNKYQKMYKKSFR
jgi:transposase